MSACYAQALHEGTALKRSSQYATKLSLGRLKWKPLPQSLGGQAAFSRLEKLEGSWWKFPKWGNASPGSQRGNRFFFPSKKEEKAVRREAFPQSHG